MAHPRTRETPLKARLLPPVRGNGQIEIFRHIRCHLQDTLYKVGAPTTVLTGVWVGARVPVLHPGFNGPVQCGDALGGVLWVPRRTERQVESRGGEWGRRRRPGWERPPTRDEWRERARYGDEGRSGWPSTMSSASINSYSSSASLVRPTPSPEPQVPTKNRDESVRSVLLPVEITGSDRLSDVPSRKPCTR